MAAPAAVRLCLHHSEAAGESAASLAEAGSSARSVPGAHQGGGHQDPNSKNCEQLSLSIHEHNPHPSVPLGDNTQNESQLFDSG